MKNQLKMFAPAIVAGLIAAGCCRSCREMPAEEAADTCPVTDAEARQLAETTLAKMTLDEKVSLLGGCATMYLKAIPRVGIDREWAMSDCSHAMKPEHRRDDFRYVEGVDDRSTALAPLCALASTWNVKLAAVHGQVMGEQMRSRGKDQMLGPGVNINRSPLCGRNWEYMSEDPYLASRMVVPLIRAVQRCGVAATVKHFALNNQELCRGTVDTVVDERTLNEIYLPAFRAAVKEGRALAVMTAYNKYNGVYCSENPYLQRGVLRDRWGFMGQIVTDWGGQHSTVAAALNGAGVEMDCGTAIHYFTDYYGTGGLPLADAVRKGDVPQSTVDEMVLHLLWTMAKTGFLNGRQAPGSRLTEAHREAAREIGEEAIVLLKNEQGVLPLDRAGIRKLAVVGLAADLKQAHLGCSCESHPSREITPFAGLREYLGDDVEVTLLPLGAESAGADPRRISGELLETFKPDRDAAYVVRAWERLAAEGTNVAGYVEYPLAPGANCKARYSARLRAPETGVFEIGAAAPAQLSAFELKIDGAKVETVARDGRWTGIATLEKDRVYAFEFAVAGGRTDETAIGWTTPSQIAARSQSIEAVCRAADATIIFTGTTMGWGRAHETEGGDRPNMDNAEGHDEDIARILSWKLPRTIVVNRSGSQTLMPWADDCATLVHMPYLGQEGGIPFARVLFGEVNPSGKLTASWPRTWEDTAVAKAGTYNDKRVMYNERFYVGYRWFDEQGIKPLFPFGYGLSYTRFEYGRPAVAQAGTGAWRITVDIRNTGERDGKEVAELYVSPVEHCVERVQKELRGFAKLEIAAGTTRTAEFKLSARDFAYYDVLTHRWRTIPGRYLVKIGGSSDNLPAVAEIEIAEEHFFED